MTNCYLPFLTDIKIISRDLTADQFVNFRLKAAPNLLSAILGLNDLNIPIPK